MIAVSWWACSATQEVSCGEIHRLALHGAPVIKCKAKDLGEQRFSLNEFISVKGVKARGKRISTDARAKVTLEDTPNPNVPEEPEDTPQDLVDSTVSVENRSDGEELEGDAGDAQVTLF